jgi:mono/diheme cytochrome c family protein
MNKRLQSALWIGLGALAGILLVGIWTPAQAYPEYTSRTGQQCTTCHVNPAGGGPRTLRGLLWIAEGRPDEVPLLPGSDAQAAGETVDGPALYDAHDCALCHGPVGEGDVGPALTEREWTAEELAGIVVSGVGTMKGYGTDAFSQAEMEALVDYVQAIGSGEIQVTVVLKKRLLPPPQRPCRIESAQRIPRSNCGGN